MKQFFFAMLVVFALGLISSCGQSGKLYLPDQTPAKEEVSDE